MATDADATEETATAEGDAAAAETPVEGTEPAEAGVEGDAKPETDEAKPEGEEKPAEEAKPAEIPEAVLQKAAQKYANKTMAAARREGARVEAIKTENETVKRELGEYKGFVQQLRASPMEALARVGFKTVREFLDHITETGGGKEEKAATVEDEVAALRAERKAEKEATAERERQAVIEQDKKNVFAAVDKDERFDFVTTEIGHAMLWTEIEEYSRLHGTVPDAAVYAIAELLEKQLEANATKTRKFSGLRPAETKTGAPAPNTAAPGARNAGKTLTNGSTAGAPSKRVYSLDPDERRVQVTEDMRLAGEL